jgi:hypothetical protein
MSIAMWSAEAAGATGASSLGRASRAVNQVTPAPVRIPTSDLSGLAGS